jgi:hypothetical protein
MSRTERFTTEDAAEKRSDELMAKGYDGKRVMHVSVESGNTAWHRANNCEFSGFAVEFKTA